jgi:regulatory protein YycH of two-component signal transduction system YycFG
MTLKLVESVTMSNNKAETFAMADYQYKINLSDKGFSYSHPVESESSEYKNFWVLRDNFGFIAAVDKKTGEIL